MCADGRQRETGQQQKPPAKSYDLIAYKWSGDRGP